VQRKPGRQERRRKRSNSQRKKSKDISAGGKRKQGRETCPLSIKRSRRMRKRHIEYEEMNFILKGLRDTKTLKIVIFLLKVKRGVKKLFGIGKE